MGGAGAGSLMGKSAEEGEELLNKYFSMFGDLKNAIDASKQKLRGVGYVEDVIGRRRHLPDINLEKYTVAGKTGTSEPDDTKGSYYVASFVGISK